MARIRSIHPGLFTDEAFMSASPHARLLIIGIWGECWDDGVFEWKPLTLKARLFPADNVDVGELLDELSALNFVKEFTSDGRRYGAVRNFQRYQRPKKPNSSGVLPTDFGTYVGSERRGSEPVPNQFRTSTEKPLQMEDGGCRKGSSEPTGSAGPPPSATAEKPSDLLTDDPTEEERQLFQRGRKVLGKEAGGLISKLLKSRSGNVALARAVIEQASTKSDPREYVGAVIRGPAGAVMPGESRMAI